MERAKGIVERGGGMREGEWGRGNGDGEWGNGNDGMQLLESRHYAIFTIVILFPSVVTRSLRTFIDTMF